MLLCITKTTSSQAQEPTRDHRKCNTRPRKEQTQNVDSDRLVKSI